MTKFERILIPVSGSETDTAALEMAYTLAGKDTEIYFVYVIEVKRSLSLDEEDEREIKKAEAVLVRFRDMVSSKGYQAQTSLLQSREVAAALADEAREREASLIIMSIHYQRQFGVYGLNPAIERLLQEAPCPVLLIQGVG